jgi:hypothetical protein
MLEVAMPPITGTVVDQEKKEEGDLNCGGRETLL